MRRIAIGLSFVAACVAVLVLLVLVRTWRVGTGSEFHADESLPAPMETAAPQLAERLGEAIRYRTVTPGAGKGIGEFLRFHRWLERTYPRAHRTLEREVHGGSLLYRWNGTDPEAAPVLLLAHLDVVPVPEGIEGDWTHPPFSGVVRDSYIWGRGTLDDKASAVGILEATEALLREGFHPARTIYFAFGHDEETGGAEGAARLAARLRGQGVRPLWVLDEGGMVLSGLLEDEARPVALVGVAEKGYLTLELQAQGAGGHSSMPPERSAIGILARALSRLEDRPLPARLTTPTRSMLETLAPYLPWLQRAAIANLWLFEPLLLRSLASQPATNAAIRTTTALTVVDGGNKDNVLPASARALVNLRLLPDEVRDGVVGSVKDRLRDLPVEVRVLQYQPASPVSPTDGEGFRQIVGIARKVFPDAVAAPFLMVAGTDSVHYRDLTPQIYRFLPVRLSQRDLARIHGTDERIGVRDYARLVFFYRELMKGAGAAL